MVSAPVARTSSMRVTRRELFAFSLQDIMLDTPQHMASSPAVFHFNDFDALNGVDELTRFVVDSHLATESTRVVIRHRRVVGLEVHVKALLDEELRRVHDLDVLEFVVSGKGSETLGTGGHQGVDAGFVDLALVVSLQLLKDLVQDPATSGRGHST